MHKVLRLSRNAVTSRYMRVVAAFAASAIMHVLTDISAGIPVRKSGAMQFFVAQALGIVVEDSVKAVWKRCFGRQATRTPETWHNVVGFLWVSAFMVWSAPAYLYPMMWRVNARENDSVIPWSLMPHIANLKTHKYTYQ